MSRVAKMPIAMPKGVDCQISAETVTVKGPKGTLMLQRASREIEVKVDNGIITLEAVNDGARALAGTYRALINNMVQGVSQGFERKLELVGVGYRASMQGKDLNLSLGFSHPVSFPTPDGITIETPSQTEILVKGADRQQVGEVAAKIRAFRPPEPYKGKGVRYSGERIVLKEAKKA
jgi:large subunit ribosomal protein L6